MKSIIVEASSIAKAVEQGWQKAGQPKEFSVKVFQEPQKNIFGLTKESAKIGFFFDDKSIGNKMQNATPVESNSPAVQSQPAAKKPHRPTQQTPPATKTEIPGTPERPVQVRQPQPSRVQQARPVQPKAIQPKPAQPRPQQPRGPQTPKVEPIASNEPIAASVQAEEQTPANPNRNRNRRRRNYFRNRANRNKGENSGGDTNSSESNQNSWTA